MTILAYPFDAMTEDDIDTVLASEDQSREICLYVTIKKLNNYIQYREAMAVGEAAHDSEAATRRDITSIQEQTNSMEVLQTLLTRADEFAAAGLALCKLADEAAAKRLDELEARMEWLTQMLTFPVPGKSLSEIVSEAVKKHIEDLPPKNPTPDAVPDAG